MTELKQKIRDLISAPQVMSFATITEDGKPWVRYVFAMADKDLTIRFATFMDSRKAKQVARNNEVHIVCGVTTLESARNYAQVQGKAEITRDEKERKDFWSDELGKYFSGLDDPRYCICIVRPYRVEYWSMEAMEPEVLNIP